MDLPLSVADDLQGRRLYSARRQSSADLPPEQGTDLVPHQSVQHASGLLGIHQLLVDLAGVLDRFLDLGFCDLIEFDPALLLGIDPQKKGQMPGNGLALPVRVGCQVDTGRLLGFLLEFLDDVALPADGNIVRFEIISDINAKFTLGKIPDMPHRCHDLIC